VPFPTFRIELQKTKHDDGLDTPTHFGPAYDEPFAATAAHLLGEDLTPLELAERGLEDAWSQALPRGQAPDRRARRRHARDGDDTASWKVRR
jgi:hypothetical protein